MSTPSQEPANSSIRVTLRDDASKRNAAVQTLLRQCRPLRALIMKPVPPLPAGSPRLRYPELKRFHLVESQRGGVYGYTFTKHGESKQAKHKLFYFAGGGFSQPPTKSHWKFCAELAACLPSYEVNVVSYPLAPNTRASEAFPLLETFIQVLTADAIANAYTITLMGDSSGGNIALGLGLFGASESLKTGQKCPIRNILVVSPAVDLRHESTAIDEINSIDPLLGRKRVEEVAAGWRGDWSFDDPRVSPLLADLTVLKKAGIKVDGVTGSHDVLTPDAIVFRDKLAELGVAGDWLQWERQMHAFPLMFSYHITEGVEAKDWIVKILKQNVEV